MTTIRAGQIVALVNDHTVQAAQRGAMVVGVAFTPRAYVRTITTEIGFSTELLPSGCRD